MPKHEFKFPPARTGLSQILRDEQLNFSADFRPPLSGEICPPGLEIRADSAEKTSGIPDILAKRGARVVLSPLSAGDYLVHGNTLVERKTVQDFARSLYSGRLFSQLKSLKEASEEILFVIEGGRWFFGQIKPKAVRMAFLSLLVSWKVPVAFTANPDDTSELLIALGKRNMSHKRAFCPSRLLHRNKSKADSSKQGVRMRMLAGIPGVGPKLAEKLLKQFGTVRELANASENDIAVLYGIGKKKAEKILWAVREPKTDYKWGIIV